MMKKHAGMAKVTKNAKIGGSCIEKIGRLLLVESSSGLLLSTVSSSPLTLQASQQPTTTLPLSATTTPCENRLNHHIDALINSASLPDQISHLKQLVSLVRNGELVSAEEIKLTIKLFLILLFDAEVQKCPLHKAVASCVDTIDGAVATSGLDITIEQMMLSYVIDSSSAKEFLFAIKCLVESPAQSVRYQTVAKNISVLTPVFTQHLISCLQQINPQSRSEDSKAHSDNVSLAHTACQVYFRLLSIASIDIDCDIVQTCEPVKPVLHHALIMGHGNMDLLVSIGLCIAQLCNNESQCEDEVQSKIEVLLGGDDVTTEQQNFAQCCLLNGIVSSFKLLTPSLHRLILNTCCHLTTVKMSSTNILVFMKMLVNWTTSLSRSTAWREFIEQEVYEPLLNYLWLVWEHSSETIRQCSRDIFACLLKAVRTNDVVRLQTLKSLVSYPWSRKGKYGFLLEYIQVVGVDETLSYLTKGTGTESILNEVISYIRHQQLANYVSELIYCLMRCDRKSHNYTQVEWTDRWLIPLVSTVQQHPQSQAHVSQNLFPKIVKVWPETIVELLKRMSSDASCDQTVVSCDQTVVSCDQTVVSCEQTVVSCDQTVMSCDQSADIYLMLARRARTSGLLAEEEGDTDRWCGVLSRKVISNSLHSCLIERRLSAFALVCESHKTSSTIREEEFTWVVEFIRYNSYIPEPSYRQQFISHLKHFLYHVLESSRKLSYLKQRPYQNFLRDLGMMQVERLKMDALANHRSVALEILTLLSSIFPSGTFSIS